MKDVMLDIESLGNGKNATIIQIGALFFDRKTGDTGLSFKVNIDARSAVASGAELDADTVYWWLSQSREAVDSVTAPPLLDIRAAMHSLNDFLESAIAIWSHATFDFVIITETFKRLGIKTKFHYRTCRDIRTLVDIANIDTKKFRSTFEGVQHDALHDCAHQVKYCVAALQKLGSTAPLEHSL